MSGLRIEVWYQGEPRGKGRPRVSTRGGFARMHTDAKTAAYEKGLSKAAASVMAGREPYAGPVKIDVEARVSVPKSFSKKKRDWALMGLWPPMTKPDMDNVLKTMDALNGIVWVDDKQVIEGTFRKRYADKPVLIIKVEAILLDGAAAEREKVLL
jgi:Holliday junction resolvase RusA-like endonuclease